MASNWISTYFVGENYPRLKGCAFDEIITPGFGGISGSKTLLLINKNRKKASTVAPLLDIPNPEDTPEEIAPVQIQKTREVQDSFSQPKKTETSDSEKVLNPDNFFKIDEKQVKHLMKKSPSEVKKRKLDNHEFKVLP